MPVPVTVSTDTVEDFSAGEPFDAVVGSLVLCSIGEPDSVLRQLLSLLRPGGELRYLERVAGTGGRALGPCTAPWNAVSHALPHFDRG